MTSPDAPSIQNIIISDPILLPEKYRRDIFDCDDYVGYLKTKMNLLAANTAGQTRPFAFGFIITSTHAYNFGIATNKKLFVLNTQSDHHDFLYPDSSNQLGLFLKLNAQNQIKLIYI
jgi:hypothetical protein